MNVNIGGFVYWAEHNPFVMVPLQLVAFVLCAILAFFIVDLLLYYFRYSNAQERWEQVGEGLGRLLIRIVTLPIRPLLILFANRSAHLFNESFGVFPYTEHANQIWIDNRLTEFAESFNELVREQRANPNDANIKWRLKWHKDRFWRAYGLAKKFGFATRKKYTDYLRDIPQYVKFAVR